MAVFYRVEQRAGRWQFRTPAGKPFFSAGVCCVTEGATAGTYRPEAPEYASFRHYRNDREWAEAAAGRLRAWNFNTIGGWSSEKVRHRGLPYTVVLHLGTYVEGGIWGDLFAPTAERAFDDAARAQVRPLANDPDLLGWFSDNELGWWDETHFIFTLQQPERSATRRTLIDLLRKHYANDFDRLRRDFDTGAVRRFDDLAQVIRVPAADGGRSAAVMDAFTEQLARRYYRLAQAAIRRYDRNHLILGDRYAQWYPAAVARAAGPYVDVISTNMGATWKNGAISRFFLERLHRLTGRPVLISEYYFAAMENRSGNKNSSGGFPTVATQKERAESVRRNLTELASLPYVVGAHWFQYTDEPTLGRKDGEDYNMGLVDIADRPYERLTAVMSEVQRRIPGLRERSIGSASRRSDRSRMAVAPPRVEEGLRYWDVRAAYLPPVTPSPFGDLYACRTAKTLYLGVHFADWADTKSYPDGKMPSAERTRWEIRWAGKQVTLRFPLERPTDDVTDDPSVRVCHTEQGATTFTAILRIVLPETQGTGKGSPLPLESELIRHGEAERVRWKTVLRPG
ncbi:MAG: hypothetical protein SFU56_17555 [Capsulimonadales bacterium]|nr:hypothetical protein [Capsulimonadales bacterium]